jgi:hypothetical protein
MKCVLHSFATKVFLIFCCAAIVSSTSWAIPGPEFNAIKKAITEPTTESIALKEPTFSEKQIDEFGKALIQSGEYLVELKLWKLSEYSQNTEVLFNHMKSNATILHLHLSDSYLSDAAFEALISLLSKTEGKDSGIEELYLDGVTASSQSWTKFAESFNHFTHLRKVSMQAIKRTRDKKEPETFSINDLLRKMALSLGEIRKMNVHCGGNEAGNEDIKYFRRQTPKFVTISYEEEAWKLPQWAKLGFLGAAGYVISSFSGSDS